MEQKTPQAPKKRPRPEVQENSNPATPLQPQPPESPFDLNTPAIATPTATPTPSKAQKLFMSLTKKKSAQIKIRDEEAAPAAKKTRSQSYAFKSRYESVTQSLLQTLRNFRLNNETTKWEQLHELALILYRLAHLLQDGEAKITPEQITKLKKLYAVLYAFIEENKVVGQHGAGEVSEQEFTEKTELFYMKLRFNEEPFDFLIKLRALIHAPAPWFNLQSPILANIDAVSKEKQKARQLLQLLKNIPTNFGVYFSELLQERIQHCENLFETIGSIAEKLEIERKNLQSDLVKTETLLETAKNTKRDLNKKSLLAERELKKAQHIIVKKHFSQTDRLEEKEKQLRQEEPFIQQELIQWEESLTQKEMQMPESDLSHEWRDLERRKLLQNEEWAQLTKQKEEAKAKLEADTQRAREKYAKCLEKLSAADQEISTIQETLKKLNIAMTRAIKIQELLTHGGNSIEDLAPQIKRAFQLFYNALRTNTDALNNQFNVLWNNGDDIIIPDEKPTPHTPPRESAAPVEYNSAAKKLLQELKKLVDTMELMEDQEEIAVGPIIAEEPMDAHVVMNLYEGLRQQREVLINYRNHFDVNTVEHQLADEQMSAIEAAIVSGLAAHKKARKFINGIQAKPQTPSPFKIRSSKFSLQSSPATSKTVTPVRKNREIAQPVPAQEETLLSFSPPKLLLPTESHKRKRDLSLYFSPHLFEEAVQQDPRYHIHDVLGDGDCGYTGFGITREDAYVLLSNNTHVREVQNLLALAMNEANLNLDFQNYVADENIDFDDAIAVAQAFIDFDLIYKQVEGGWPHPAILFALAQIRGIGIRIWRTDINGELIPNRADDNYDYFEHIPEGATDVIDLLYRGNSHFDRLDIEDEYLKELLFTHARVSQPSPKKLHVVKEVVADDDEVAPTQKVSSGSPMRSMFDPQPITILKSIKSKFSGIQTAANEKILVALENLITDKPIDEKNLKLFAKIQIADLERLLEENVLEKEPELKTEIQLFKALIQETISDTEIITVERLEEFMQEINRPEIKLGK